MSSWESWDQQQQNFQQAPQRPGSQPHPQAAVPPHMGGGGGSGSGLTRRSNPGIVGGVGGGGPQGQRQQQPQYANPYQQTQPQRPSKPAYSDPYSGGGAQSQHQQYSSSAYQPSNAQPQRPQQPTTQHRIFPPRSVQQTPQDPYAPSAYGNSAGVSNNAYSPSAGYASGPNPSMGPQSSGSFGGSSGVGAGGGGFGGSSQGPTYPAAAWGPAGPAPAGDYGQKAGVYSGAPGAAPGSAFFGSQFINEMQGSVGGQLGMQLGQQALQQGTQIVNQNLNRYVNVTKLKYYFNVSNSYVFNKIALVVFPFRNKHWTRLVNRSEQDGQMEGYKPPREDLNAPDMYIPVMAIVTYVLLVGMLLGSNKDGRTFSPDALGTTASSAIFFIAVELMVMKLGCYLLNVQNEVPSLDIISLCGYKFLGVNSAVTAKIFFSYKVVYSIFAYHMLAFFFFTLRTMKYLLLPDASDTAVIVPQRQRRVYFLFGFALFQTVMAFTLVYAV